MVTVTHMCTLQRKIHWNLSERGDKRLL